MKLKFIILLLIIQKLPAASYELRRGWQIDDSFFYYENQNYRYFYYPNKKEFHIKKNDDSKLNVYENDHKDNIIDAKINSITVESNKNEIINLDKLDSLESIKGNHITLTSSKNENGTIKYIKADTIECNCDVSLINLEQLKVSKLTNFVQKIDQFPKLHKVQFRIDTSKDFNVKPEELYVFFELLKVKKIKRVLHYSLADTKQENHRSIQKTWNRDKPFLPCFFQLFDKITLYDLRKKMWVYNKNEISSFSEDFFGIKESFINNYRNTLYEKYNCMEKCKPCKYCPGHQRKITSEEEELVKTEIEDYKEKITNRVVPFPEDNNFVFEIRSYYDDECIGRFTAVASQQIKNLILTVPCREGSEKTWWNDLSRFLEYPLSSKRPKEIFKTLNKLVLKQKSCRYCSDSCLISDITLQTMQKIFKLFKNLEIIEVKNSKKYGKVIFEREKFFRYIHFRFLQKICFIFGFLLSIQAKKLEFCLFFFASWCFMHSFTPCGDKSFFNFRLHDYEKFPELWF